MSNDILMQMLWMFPVYSFFGWCLEVINSAAYRGKLSNRGFLNGSICPVYGVGAIMLALLFTPIKDNLFLLFFAAMVTASAVELTVGFLLKKCFHMTWWDYSDKKFNLGGYICLQVSLIWGVAGVMLLRVIHPMFYYAEISIPPLIVKVLLIAFYIYFLVDIIITLLSILKFNHALREITKLSDLIHKGSDVMANDIGLATLDAVDKIKNLDLDKKANIKKLNDLLDYSANAHARMLNAFPKMKSLRNSNALLEVKRRVADLAKKKD